MSVRNKHYLGFTLVEMAIVLLIVALLLGGLLPTVTSQIEIQHRGDTRKQLSEIQQALIGYTLVNGRLPCPADPTTPTGQLNAANVPAGQEYKNPPIGANYVCNNVQGVLPWVTLGIPETDAWGRRYTYRVTQIFADDIALSTFGCAAISIVSSFALCSNGDINVLTAAGGGTNVASNIPAVIVSHGTNGNGAYTSQGIQIPIGADADEMENSNANITFVSHDSNSTFDDMVVWIAPSLLFNRMVSAGKLP